MVAEPIRIGTIENSAKKQSHDSKQYRVYSPEGKATTLCGEGGGLGAKTGLYAAPVRVGTMPKTERLLEDKLTGSTTRAAKLWHYAPDPTGAALRLGFMPTPQERLKVPRGAVETMALHTR